MDNRGLKTSIVVAVIVVIILCLYLVYYYFLKEEIDEFQGSNNIIVENIN